MADVVRRSSSGSEFRDALPPETRLALIEQSLSSLAETYSEDHRRLRAIEEALMRVEAQLSSLVKLATDVDERVKLVSARVDAVERWRENWLGRAAVLSILGGAVLAVATALLTSAMGK